MNMASMPLPLLPENHTTVLLYSSTLKPCLHLIHFNAHPKPVSKPIGVDAHQSALMRFAVSTLLIGTQRKKKQQLGQIFM